MRSFMGIVSKGAKSAVDIEMTNKYADVHILDFNSCMSHHLRVSFVILVLVFAFLLSGVQIAIFACVLLSS